MRLQQGQIWKKGDDYYRIVQWARHAIEYKHMTDLETKEGSFHELPKKEFCRLIKHGELQLPPAVEEPTVEEPTEDEPEQTSDDHPNQDE